MLWSPSQITDAEGGWEQCKPLRKIAYSQEKGKFSSAPQHRWHQAVNLLFFVISPNIFQKFKVIWGVVVNNCPTDIMLEKFSLCFNYRVCQKSFPTLTSSRCFCFTRRTGFSRCKSTTYPKPLYVLGYNNSPLWGSLLPWLLTPTFERRSWTWSWSRPPTSQ